jgi:hypothetical protein
MILASHRALSAQSHSKAERMVWTSIRKCEAENCPMSLRLNPSAPPPLL